MKPEYIMKCVDHTLLKPYASWEDIVTLCNEAVTYQTASVCIPPSYVKRVKEQFGSNLNICTVIGFPLGYHTAQIKLCEAEQALIDGADELDMVINLTDVKNGQFLEIEEEIKLLKQAAGSKILKVIIETCFLSNEEKIKMCQVVTKSGADYIKTSTGFGTAGATIEDIRIMKKHIGANVKIKAAGGIRTLEDMEVMIEEGCSRIGTSSAVILLKKGEAKSY